MDEKKIIEGIKFELNLKNNEFEARYVGTITRYNITEKNNFNSFIDEHLILEASKNMAKKLYIKLYKKVE